MTEMNTSSDVFASLPHRLDPNVNLKPFNISVKEEDISKLQTLLKLCPIAQPTWENSGSATNFGVSRTWLNNAVKYWQEEYDWRKMESALNSFPQYSVDVQDDDGKTYAVRFLSLFSTKKTAVSIVFLHGWPGSVVEFLPMLRHVRAQYPSPEELPYHVIVPHLVGFGYSSPPPLDKDFMVEDNARIVSKMMHLLGFTAERGGYVAQGGDLGGAVAPSTAALDPACRLVHVNFILMPNPEGIDVQTDIVNGRYDEDEVESLQRGAEMDKSGSAYAQIQGTRPVTAGFAMGSSPVGLLAWVGEKMLQWADSLPMGYSWFKLELMNPPQRWLQAMGKVQWFRKHEKGGHFAALERPEQLWKDVTDFVQEFWS